MLYHIINFFPYQKILAIVDSSLILLKSLLTGYLVPKFFTVLK